MDSILKDVFGFGRDEAPAAAAPAAPEGEQTKDEAREARRAARRQRRADPERKRKRDDFFARYTTGSPTEGFTAEEALEHLGEMRDELGPEEFQAAMVQTLEHLPEDQRDEFIALIRKHREATAAASPVAEPAAATANAAASPESSQPAAADPFGGLLTGLFGGASGATAGGVDPGSVLDDLRKGGLSAPSTGSGKPTEADFLSLINSPLGKAVLGGLAAFGMQQMRSDRDDQDSPSRA